MSACEPMTQRESGVSGKMLIVTMMEISRWMSFQILGTNRITVVSGRKLDNLRTVEVEVIIPELERLDMMFRMTVRVTILLNYIMPRNF
jgi:hypothetical protein